VTISCSDKAHSKWSQTTHDMIRKKKKTIFWWWWYEYLDEVIMWTHRPPNADSATISGMIHSNEPIAKCPKVWNDSITALCYVIRGSILLVSETCLKYIHNTYNGNRFGRHHVVRCQNCQVCYISQHINYSH